MNRIMIVDDAETIRKELASFLESCGYKVSALENFSHVVQDILQEKPDLILLDINLPYADGYRICRELRKKSDIPILVVTSRNSEVDELMSMNLGADDFIAKPYNLHILEARISAILRRSQNAQTRDVIEYKGLSLDLLSGTVSYQGENVLLTKNELKMLAFLIQHQGNIVSRDDLMEYMWSSEAFIDDNNLSVNMTRLRKKLEQLGFPETIETRRGLGYQLP